MPESSALPSEEVTNYLATRFGVSRDFLARLAFVENRGEIWACRPPALTLHVRGRRPPGLRALRRAPDGLKPTSAFLVALGPEVTAGLADVTREELRLLLLGQRIPSTHAPGYVALAYGGDVLGCGRVANAALQALIPTGRRGELLSILRADFAAM
ncbi:MAG: hypothetical protein AB1778_07910 [Candidatus Bipolaricaulota bacterium]